MSDSLPPQDHSARPVSLDRERGRDESSRGGDLPASASSRYDDGREPRSPHRPSDRRDDDYRDGNPRGRDTVESKTKLYVGNLSSKTEKRDLEDVFNRCGELVSVEVKHNGYAFVEYEDARDAEDAVHKLRDYELHGSRLTVEYSRSRQGGSGSGCFLCGGLGHWARECPDSRTRGMDVKSGLCFKCGQPGHLARHCRGGGGGGSYGGYRGGRDSYYGGRGRSRSPPRGYGRSPSPYGGRGGYGGGYGGDRRRSPVYNDYRGAPGGGYDDRRY